MKLIGLVFLGLVASTVFYFPVFMLVALVSGAGFEIEVNEFLTVLAAFFIVLPVSFFLGSAVTGFFSYYDIENKSSLLLMAPVLYVELIWICTAGVNFALDAFIGVNPPGPGFLRRILFSVMLGLLWYITSAGGVFLGYYLRERFAKWWYRD